MWGREKELLKLELDDDMYLSLDFEKQFDSIMGLQFENLILNHLSEVVRALKIPFNCILSASPYFQEARSKNKGACQIDLLIQCKNNIWYICEFKFQKQISVNVISEIQNKMNLISKPRGTVLRAALIYLGHVSDTAEQEFAISLDRTLDFATLL